MKAPQSIIRDRAHAAGFRPARHLVPPAVVALGVALSALVSSGIDIAPADAMGAHGWGSLACAMGALAALNLALKPVMGRITVPLALYLWGVALCFINAGALALCGRFVPGFSVADFGAALTGGVIVGACAFVANLVFRAPRKSESLTIVGMDTRNVMVPSREEYRDD